MSTTQGGPELAGDPACDQAGEAARLAERLRPGAGDPTLWLLCIANYAVLLALGAGFLPTPAFAPPARAGWLAAVWLTYPALYLLPALAIAWGARRGAAALGRAGHRRLAGTLAVAPAALLFAAVQLAIAGDARLHALYGFHLNGFVWNLVTTPGGIAALGAGRGAELALAAVAAAVFAGEAVLLLALPHLRARAPWLAHLHARRVVVSVALGLAVLSLGERFAFGASRVAGYTPVLELEEAFPFYARTSFNGLARRLGFSVARPTTPAVRVGNGPLAYPLRPLAFRADAPRFNVVVLCAESLRADALDPELMPAAWRFASGAVRFTQHLSAGNGTRMGVFGLFYGLPGPYWFRALDAHRGPVLVRALLDRGWDVRGYTSDDFSYPEFDRTVFADVDRSKLREGGTGASWQRDRAQVDAILDFLGHRDPARPFFLYAFFESPHARYEFPPESVVRTPYLDTLNYVTMDLHRDIHLIQNRYWNSVHHLDSQLARVLDALSERGLLDSTIVVITGDHGEEFLEKGHWGHNSAFTEEQIRVPLVLRVPGRAPAVVDRLTSHLDLPATLLTALGVTNPPADYGLGQDLLDGTPRHWALVSDWSRVAYVDAGSKATFPMRLASFARQVPSDRHDAPLADPGAWRRAHAPIFAQVMTSLARFQRPAGRVAVAGR